MPKYLDPPVSYNFSVSITPSKYKRVEDTYFSEISGISSEIDVEVKKEGGQNDYVYHLPKGAKASRITLKRGLASVNSEIIDWCFKTINLETTKIEPKQLVISLLDKNPKSPRMTWAFYNAIPVKWLMSDFNAQESNVAIESIELVFSKMEILSS
jgi:phage tail-like protein